MLNSTQWDTIQRLVVPGLDEVAQGVLADIFDIAETDEIYLAMVVSTEPRRGNVGRWLDSLPRDRTIVVPYVISYVLNGMLERRGFVEEERHYPDLDAPVQCMVRAAQEAV